VPIKQEPDERPRRCAGGGIVIHGSHKSSPPRHQQQPRCKTCQRTPPLEYKLPAIQLKVEEGPDKYPDQRIAERASFQETDEYIEQWSAVEHRCEEAERTCHLSLFIDLIDTDNTDLSNM
jgi:hypothetical protein